MAEHPLSRRVCKDKQNFLYAATLACLMNIENGHVSAKIRRDIRNKKTRAIINQKCYEKGSRRGYSMILLTLVIDACSTTG